MKCNDINKCEWSWCYKRNVCLLEQQEKTKKPTIEIAGIKNHTYDKFIPLNQSVVKILDKRKNNTKNSLIKGTRLKMFERDGFKCVFCKCDIIELLTADHIIPKSKGGKSTLENLQTLCKKCNNIKADNYPYKNPFIMITLQEDLTKLKNLRNSIYSFERCLNERQTWRENRIHLRKSLKKLRRLVIVIGKKSNIIEIN